MSQENQKPALQGGKGAQAPGKRHSYPEKGRVETAGSKGVKFKANAAGAVRVDFQDRLTLPQQETLIAFIED